MNLEKSNECKKIAQFSKMYSVSVVKNDGFNVCVYMFVLKSSAEKYFVNQVEDLQSDEDIYTFRDNICFECVECKDIHSDKYNGNSVNPCGCMACLKEFINQGSWIGSDSKSVELEEHKMSTCEKEPVFSVQAKS